MTRERSDTGDCRSCSAPIIWTKTRRGKAMPCDLKPVEDGDFFLFRRSGHIEAVHVRSQHPSAAKAHERKQDRFKSHFATCPQAGQHRRS